MKTLNLAAAAAAALFLTIPSAYAASFEAQCATAMEQNNAANIWAFCPDDKHTPEAKAEGVRRTALLDPQKCSDAKASDKSEDIMTFCPKNEWPPE